MKGISRFGVALAALAAVGLAIAAPAKATDPPWMKGSRIASPDSGVPFNWTGIYVGGMGGYGVADAEISHEGFNFDGVSGDGWRGDVKAGLNWHIKNTPVVLRSHVCYNFGSTETTLNVGPGAFTASAKHTPEWCVGGGLGLAFANKTMLYGDLAWQRAKGQVSWQNNVPALAVTGGDSQTSDGRVWTLGLEHAVTNNLSFALEYNLGQHEYKVEDTRVNVNEHVFGARLNLSFGPGLFN